MNHRHIPLFAAVFGIFVVAHCALAQEGVPKSSAKPDAKPQAAVAAKNVTLATVAASDPKVKAALDAKDLAGAKKLAGKPGAFVGTVADVYTSRGNRVTKLNFDQDFKKAMTAVVFPPAYGKFPDLKSLKGKKLLVSGKVEEYRGGFEIVLNGPDQVKVVK
jgi:hypothetical protein